MTTICIGRKGAGKTHLLSCLRDPTSINFTTHSVSTVGANIFRIKNPKDPAQVKHKGHLFLDIREIGGKMSPLWDRWFDNVNRMIFVIDTSNLCEISGAAALFYSALVDVRLSKADVLLVLTKMDLAYRQMRNEAILMLNLNKIIKQSKQKITIVETSAVAKTGLDKVLEWLFK